MGRRSIDKKDETREKIKRARRARGGRILPRSGAGAHKSDKRRRLDEILEEEMEEEIEDPYDLEDDELLDYMEELNGEISEDDDGDETAN